MCHKTTCSKCNKPTWSGCGKHVESALGGVTFHSILNSRSQKINDVTVNHGHKVKSMNIPSSKEQDVWSCSTALFGVHL